jgi:hypothetical protein
MGTRDKPGYSVVTVYKRIRQPARIAHLTASGATIWLTLAPCADNMMGTPFPLTTSPSMPARRRSRLRAFSSQVPRSHTNPRPRRRASGRSSKKPGQTITSNLCLPILAGGWSVLWRSLLFALSCVFIIPIPRTLHWYVSWTIE